MKNYNELKTQILNEAMNSINEEFAEYNRRKAVLESFGYEYDMDKLPRLDKSAKSIKAYLLNVSEVIKTPEDNIGMFDIVEYNKRDKYVVARFFGGLNGPGVWTDYLKTVHKLFELLEEQYDDCWLVQLVNDCLDDVFTLDIGIKDSILYNK